MSAAWSKLRNLALATRRSFHYPFSTTTTLLSRYQRFFTCPAYPSFHFHVLLSISDLSCMLLCTPHPNPMALTHDVLLVQVAVWHTATHQMQIMNTAHVSVTPVFIFNACPDTYKIRNSGILNSAFIRLDNVSWAALPPEVLYRSACFPPYLHAFTQQRRLCLGPPVHQSPKVLRCRLTYTKYLLCRAKPASTKWSMRIYISQHRPSTFWTPPATEMRYGHLLLRALIPKKKKTTSTSIMHDKPQRSATTSSTHLRG